MKKAVGGIITVVMVVLLWGSLVWPDSNPGKLERLQPEQQAVTTATQRVTSTSSSLQETFARLCNTSRYSRSMEREARGAIWIYAPGRDDSSTKLATRAHADSEQEARTLVCIFDSTHVESCRYIGSITVPVTLTDTDVTLVDIQSAEKVGQTTLRVSCPGQIKSPVSLPVKSGPSRTAVAEWVMQHWSPSKTKRPPKLGTAHVSHEQFSIYSEPDLYSKKLGKFSNSMELWAIMETDHWLQVETPSGIRGWLPKLWIVEQDKRLSPQMQ